MYKRQQLIALLQKMEEGKFEECMDILRDYAAVYDVFPRYDDERQYYQILIQNEDFCEWVVKNKPFWFVNNVHYEVNRHAGIEYNYKMYFDSSDLDVYDDLDEIIHEIKCTNLGAELIEAVARLTEEERNAFNPDIEPESWRTEGYTNDSNFVLVAVLLDYYKKQEK